MMAISSVVKSENLVAEPVIAEKNMILNRRGSFTTNFVPLLTKPTGLRWLVLLRIDARALRLNSYQ